MLDVGSGIGRMARPLTKFLTSGSYVGIDIVPRGIEWCQRHITSRYPNFTFQHADVYNKEYNPTGGRGFPISVRGRKLRFPAGERCWMHNRRIPEQAIAYDEAVIRSRYNDARLIVTGPEIWCGRAEHLSYQDMLIAEKVG